MGWEQLEFTETVSVSATTLGGTMCTCNAAYIKCRSRPPFSFFFFFFYHYFSRHFALRRLRPYSFLIGDGFDFLSFSRVHSLVRLGCLAPD